MKKNIFFSILLAFAAISFTSAQSLDNILDNHFKAIGQKKLVKMKSMQAIGKVTMMGMDSPLTMNIKRPNKVKVVVDYQGSNIIQAFDGETAWTLNPFMGSSAPVDVTGAQADYLAESGDMDGQLWKYKDKGHQLELEGKEEINGKGVFALKLTKKNGNVDYYYIDQKSYLLSVMKTETDINGMNMEVEVLFSNYQEVDGIVMAFSTEQKFGGQAGNLIKFDELKFNVKLDDSIFSKSGAN